MCACVCICAYMYVYVYICIYTYMCVCVCICILICMSVFNMALGFIALFYLLLSSKALFATIFLYEKCYINKVWLIDFAWRVLSPLASTSGSSSYSHDMHHQPWGHNSRKLQLQSKVLNMVHSDSMSPTFPDTWEKCELSSSQRGASTKLSQFILTSCVGLPGLPNSPPCLVHAHKQQSEPSLLRLADAVKRLSRSPERTPTRGCSSRGFWVSPNLPCASLYGQLQIRVWESPALLQEFGSRAQLYLVGTIPSNTPAQALFPPAKWHSTSLEPVCPCLNLPPSSHWTWPRITSMRVVGQHGVTESNTMLIHWHRLSIQFIT